jgi:hypothetical protein
MITLFIISLIGIICSVYCINSIIKVQDLGFLDYYILLLFPGIAFIFSIGGILYCIGVIFGVLTIK